MREVFQEDAVAWLERAGKLSGSSLATSLPDYSEFPGQTLDEWKAWFEAASELVMRATPPEGVAVFYQRDSKIDGVWIDKAFLIQKAAERAGHAQLWHKIVARAPAGSVTFGKPAYSHLLCFSSGVRLEPGQAAADMIPEAGERSWPRGMGRIVCETICRFVMERTTTRRIVAPFCGEGALLAVANEMGLRATGIELSRKRAEKARAFASLLNSKSRPS